MNNEYVPFFYVDSPLYIYIDRYILLLLISLRRWGGVLDVGRGRASSPKGEDSWTGWAAISCLEEGARRRLGGGK